MHKKIVRKESRKSDSSIDDQVENSFPASDPPSYNAGARIGEPMRTPAQKTVRREKDSWGRMSAAATGSE